MIIKFAVLLFFSLFTTIGFFSTIRDLRKLRSPRKYKDSIFAWVQHPLSGYKHEGESWIAMSIHWIALTSLGFITFLRIVLTPPIEINFLGLTGSIVMVILQSVLLVGSIAAGYLWGRALSQPLAHSIGGDSYFAISTEGILYMGYLFPWNALGRFTFNSEQNVVYLWSALFPRLIAFVMSPPSPHMMTTLIKILNDFLPSETVNSSSFFQIKYSFPALVTVISLPVVILASLMFKLPLSCALIINAGLLYMLTSLGGKPVIDNILKAQPAKIE